MGHASISNSFGSPVRTWIQTPGARAAKSTCPVELAAIESKFHCICTPAKSMSTPRFTLADLQVEPLLDPQGMGPSSAPKCNGSYVHAQDPRLLGPSTGPDPRDVGTDVDPKYLWCCASTQFSWQDPIRLGPTARPKANGSWAEPRELGPDGGPNSLALGLAARPNLFRSACGPNANESVVRTQFFWVLSQDPILFCPAATPRSNGSCIGI
uniref:Uncharacterized protein n=1 Tax=Populus trichocarpa TaxID=3694 RepID=A0A2K2AUR7_POPTR